MLLTSCVSNKVEYKIVVPTLEFPEFPMADNITENPDKTCTVDSNWIVQLSLFKIRYDAVSSTYEQLKDYLENNK